MRRPGFWKMALPLGLIATPALAAQGQRDMSNDCFDVAAPMADATPCYQPGRHTHEHHAHHERIAAKTDSEQVDAASNRAVGGTQRHLTK